mmetsp:Transcript_24992/g.28799  ORF Transcript_24992/g.28799 Transcript_24992/m.28799 type:complete len:102 (-) Transcript_24992:200-505(-)
MRHSRVDRRTLWPFLLDPEDDDVEDEWLIRGCIGTPWEMYNLASSKASECSPRTQDVTISCAHRNPCNLTLRNTACAALRDDLLQTLKERQSEGVKKEATQ